MRSGQVKPMLADVVQAKHSYINVNFRIADDSHPQRALRHKSLVPPCFVNQLSDRFAWSVNDRSRSNVYRLLAATRKRKAEGRHAREALAQNNLYPRIAALSRRVLPSGKV